MTLLLLVVLVLATAHAQFVLDNRPDFARVPLYKMHPRPAAPMNGYNPMRMQRRYQQVPLNPPPMAPNERPNSLLALIFLRSRMAEGFQQVNTRLDRLESTLFEVAKQVEQGTKLISNLSTSRSSGGASSGQGMGAITQPRAVTITDNNVNAEVSYSMDVQPENNDLTSARRAKPVKSKSIEEEDEEDCDEDDDKCEVIQAFPTASKTAKPSDEIVSRRIVNFESDDEATKRVRPVARKQDVEQEQSFPVGRKVGIIPARSFPSKPRRPHQRQPIVKPMETTEEPEPVTTTAESELVEVIKEMEADEASISSTTMPYEKVTEPEEFRIDAEKLPLIGV